MKACKSLQKLIPLYLDGRLSLRASQKLQNHLKECSSCRTELIELEESLRILKLYEKITPQIDLKSTILKRAEYIKRPTPLKPSSWILPAASLAAATLIGVLLFLHLREPQITLPKKENIIQKLAKSIKLSKIFLEGLFFLPEDHQRFTTLVKEELEATGLEKDLHLESEREIPIPEKKAILEYLKNFQEVIKLIKAGKRASEVKGFILSKGIIENLVKLEKKFPLKRPAGIKLATKDDENEDQRLFKRAREHLYNLKTQLASECFRKIKERFPKSPYRGASSAWLAEYESSLGNYQNALENLLEAKYHNFGGITQLSRKILEELKQKDFFLHPKVLSSSYGRVIILGPEDFQKFIQLKHPQRYIHRLTIKNGKKRLLRKTVFFTKKTLRRLKNIERHLHIIGPCQRAVRIKRKFVDVDMEVLNKAAKLLRCPTIRAELLKVLWVFDRLLEYEGQDFERKGVR
jgi:hypothetical protein